MLLKKKKKKTTAYVWRGLERLDALGWRGMCRGLHVCASDSDGGRPGRAETGPSFPSAAALESGPAGPAKAGRGGAAWPGMPTPERDERVCAHGNTRVGARGGIVHDPHFY